MRYGSIYIATNKHTGEQYVGQTRQPVQKRDPAIGRMLVAQAKWKPVYCPELQCSFQSQKAAAEFFGVLRTSVCNAVKQKGKVAGKFTLEMVA
jgi:hypothetical protein